MKWKTLLLSIGLSLLVAGCQNNGGDAVTSNPSSSSSDSNPSSEDSLSEAEDMQDAALPIEETEYGRGATSDGADTNASEAATRILTDEASSIIIFFSRSGNTQNLARMIHNHNGADMLELTVTNPYPADYEAAVSRATEERENQAYPEISTDIPDLSQYDSIYLGYQTWAMTLSNPMTSFLMDHGSDLSGKTIYPFSTNAGYGEGNTLSRISELAPNATIATSFSIQDEELLDNQEQVLAWVEESMQ